MDPALVDDQDPSLIPARRGKAMRLERGQIVRVINKHGTQVIDTWAFNGEDMNEFMSMEHSRTSLLRTIPIVGDSLVTNRRRPILTLVSDTSPGVHDTLIAACDTYRYDLLCGEPAHDNCTNNLRSALEAIGLSQSVTPAPLNLFMNVAILEEGRLEFRPPVCAPGDHVELRAEMDLVIVFSACPQDIMPVNNFAPTEAYFVVRAIG